MEADDTERARRLRAIAGYANWSLDTTAGHLHVSRRQASRILSGGVTISSDVLADLAALAGIPPWFARHGFSPPAEAGGEVLLERVGTLERQVAALMQREGAKGAPAPPGAGDRQGPARRSSGASRKPSARKPAAGST